MRVAALYDIHGNLPALRAVLAEVAGADVDLVVVGGDVVSGPQPDTTLEALLALGSRVRFVCGNADREVVAAYDAGRLDPEAEGDPGLRADAFAASRLSRPQRDLLASFEPTVTTEIAGLGPTVFGHGSPRSDTEIITTLTPDERLRGILADVAEPVVVGGHVHTQYDRRLDRWRVVNAGSVGIPYEGRPGAYWALFGPDVELRRTEYDVEAALAEMRGGGFPDIEDTFRESLIEPIDPVEVAAFFEARVG